MNITTSAVIAVVSALALFGVVMVTVATTTMLLQEAEARGCPVFGQGFFASEGRCLPDRKPAKPARTG